MFNIGDKIIYSVHGLCQIDDICEKTFYDVTRTYFVLHPLDQSNLTISIPVDSEKAVILKTLSRKEAEEILHSFKLPGIDWINDIRQRSQMYIQMINDGNRMVIAKIANTLMRKTYTLSKKNKRLYDQDRKLLHTIENALFKDLAISLDTSVDNILIQINNMIMISEDCSVLVEEKV